jgi:hypothetical protein
LEEEDIVIGITEPTEVAFWMVTLYTEEFCTLKRRQFGNPIK